MADNVMDAPTELDCEPTGASLRHLERFNNPINKGEEFRNITNYFLYGGWPKIIEQFFYESPVRNDSGYSPALVFPGSELAAHRIDPYPIIYPNDSALKLGDMILQTAWIRGLSPRLYFYYPAGPADANREDRINKQITVIRFIEKSKHMPLPAPTAPGIEFVDHSLLQWCAPEILINTNENDVSRGIPLSDFKTEYLDANFPEIVIEIKPELRPQLINMEITSSSLAEILDAVAYCLDATWDWVDKNKIYIAPVPGYSASVTSCIGEGCE